MEEMIIVLYSSAKNPFLTTDEKIELEKEISRLLDKFQITGYEIQFRR